MDIRSADTAAAEVKRVIFFIIVNMLGFYWRSTAYKFFRENEMRWVKLALSKQPNLKLLVCVVYYQLFACIIALYNNSHWKLVVVYAIKKIDLSKKSTDTKSKLLRNTEQLWLLFFWSKLVKRNSKL